MPTKNELVEQLRTELAAARTLSDKAQAGNREYTDGERTQIQRHLDQARDLKSRADQAKTDEEITAAIADLGDAIGGGGKASATTTRPRSVWAKTAMERVAKQQHATGAKALVTGSLDVPTPIDTEVVRMAEYPTRVLDLLVDRVPIANTNTFSFVQQAVRTDNAAPVADETEKPVSIYTVNEVEDRVRVIAHLSEALPERLLADHAELGDFLEVEMERGLREALEEQIVGGDGLGENMTGILNTSGVLTQPYATDLPTTLRKARTTLAVQREVPNAWLLHPSDTEAIDLLREGADGGFLLATPPGNVLGNNLPIIESTVVPVGTAVLADWTWARLIVRQDTTLDVDRSGDLFTTNRVRLRLEGRWGFAIRRTTAFCEVDLTAA